VQQFVTGNSDTGGPRKQKSQFTEDSPPYFKTQKKKIRVRMRSRVEGRIIGKV